jgi:hypothetical protein
MINLTRVAGILGCSAAIAATSLAANAGMAKFNPGPYHAQPLGAVKYIGNGWWNDNGIVYRTPHYMPTREHASKVHRDAGALVYHGGPVLTNPKIYVVLWGFKSAGDPNKVGKLLKKYLGAFGGSAIGDVLTQYYDIVGGVTTNITNPTHQLIKIWKDNTNPIPAHPTDAQVAAEAGKLMAQVGYDVNASYAVATAHNHSSSGFGTSYCAYHGWTNQGGQNISYTNLPYQPDAGSSCGANIIAPPSDEAGADEGVSIVEGHEYAESVTDPNVSNGWYTNGGSEIGDICAWQDIENDPMAGGSSYTMQPEYSNATASCVHHL